MEGYINKIESMSTIDGPGIRTVVFLQGCHLRCLYCHNPETWKLTGDKISSNDLVNKILRFKDYFGESGGVTFSGGEPLLQEEFLLETLKLLKKNNIHTCIDTAGYKIKEELLDYVDLVLLDIKALNDNEYIKITGSNMDNFNYFINLCEKKNKRVWIRHVIIPGINDSKEYILKLKEKLNYKCIEKIDLLPYHTMALSKYKDLNIPYRLSAPAMDKEVCKKLEELL